MPKKKNAANKGAAQAAEEPVKSSEERKIPYQVLKANCMKLFRVTSSTFSGATIGRERGAYTLTEMKSILDSWLRKEVKKS